MTFDHIATLLVVVAAVPANLFPLAYGLGSPWYRSPLGRALMTQSTGIALLIDVTMLRYVLGDYPGRDAIRIAIYGLVTAGLYLQFVALLKTQRTRRRTPPTPGRRSTDA